jgi:DNA-binding transcriptional MerR regulator/methylmalonyl-CoA mutase cobalamin-binding subunit
MTVRAAPHEAADSIASVERDTGLSKDTLRMWERRYDFPQPGRDSSGERRYSPEEVDKLRVIKRLMDQGHRPGKIIGYSTMQLLQLAQAAAAAPRLAGTVEQHADDLQRLLGLAKQHRIEELRRELSQSLLRLGLSRFVMEIVAPLNEQVGEAWSCGDFEIFEEHLYTASMQMVLHNAINTIPQPANHQGGRPRILLTTLPQEQHGLGLLMAEALCALEGGRCFSLGVQTPAFEIVRAAITQSVDIVALSFSAAMSASHVLNGLAELRSKLPASIELWAGGASHVLKRRPPHDVRCLSGLHEIAGALIQWRAAHS